MAVICVYSLFTLAIVITTVGILSAHECQLNCTAPLDPDDKIRYDLSNGCQPFPFGNDPSVHEWSVSKPKDLIVEEKTYPCQSDLLLGLIIKWKPPEYGIDKVKGFQVRVTPFSASEVGGYPIMCHDVLFRNDTQLGPSDSEYRFSLDCLNHIFPGRKYYIEVQSLPKPMPGPHEDNTASISHTAKNCEDNPRVVDCPSGGKGVTLENYMYHSGDKPQIRLDHITDVVVTFQRYPDFYNVTSYVVQLCTYKRGCVSRNEVTSYYTTFKNVTPGLYEAWVAPSGCPNCIWQITSPINVTQWKPSFVKIDKNVDQDSILMEVYFDVADWGAAGSKIDNYVIELININSSETRSLTVSKNPAVFDNMQSGLYRARARAAGCDCPWATSESVQVYGPSSPDAQIDITPVPAETTAQKPAETTAQKPAETTKQKKDVGKIAIGVVGGVIGGIILLITLYLIKRNIRKKKATMLTADSTSEFLEEMTYSIDETQDDNDGDTDALINSAPATATEKDKERQYKYYKPSDSDESSTTERMSSIIRTLNLNPNNQQTVFDHGRKREVDGLAFHSHQIHHNEFSHAGYDGYHDCNGGHDQLSDMYSPYKSNEPYVEKFDSGFQEMEQLEAMRTLVVEGLKAHSTTVSADVHNDSYSVNI